VGAIRSLVERNEFRSTEIPIVAHRFALCVVLLSLALSFGCGPGTGDPTVIKIVSSLPRTGSAKDQTDTIVNGIELALEEAGRKVGDFRIVYEDMNDATASANSWTAEAETFNANSAAADPDCMVYIGPFNSGAAAISMPILNEAGLLMISPSNTATGLTKPGMGKPNEPGVYRPTGKLNYTRVVPTDDLQGQLAAEWAQEMGMKKVYIIDDTEVYGDGLADHFEDHCKKIGIEVLGRAQIDPKSQEYKTLMTTIKAQSPDLIYFGGTTQSNGGQLLKDMVGVGLNAKFMAPDGCFEEVFITAAGAENANGRAFITFGGFPPSELEALGGPGADFVKKYRERFKAEPEAYATYGYECARVALEAIRQAGKKDRAAIVAAALGLKDFNGVLGKWSFDANGDTTMQVMSGNTVENGKFKFVKRLERKKPE
jgi:branched-chain amino acid transport system substrate-binding protein